MPRPSDIKHVIVQAGGKGDRMGKLTANRPKCLLPVEGTPLLLHLSKHFPNAHFIVIADYKREILTNYLMTVDSLGQFTIVHSEGNGDVAGIGKALELIPHQPFVIIWSDLFVDSIPDIDYLSHNYIGLTREIECRWSCKDDQVREVTSNESGILGFFTFTDKSQIPPLPRDGQFLESIQDIEMHPVFLDGTVEIGNPDVYSNFSQPVGRPYNTLTISEDNVIKECAKETYAYKIPMEASWYLKVKALGFDNIPSIKSDNPLCMERIKGKHPFEINPDAKTLSNIMNTVDSLHSLGQTNFDQSSCQRAHIDIPTEALDRVARLIPQGREYKVNGKLCINPYIDRSVFDQCRESFAKRPFLTIHGECTFSNTIIRDDGKVYLIDPSPCYGVTEQPFGNPLYDWSKIFYSISGCYDMFNQKNFGLSMNSKNIDLKISPSGWEQYIAIFEDRFTGEELAEIKMMHALEWFLLSAHCTDDTDAIIAAFFNGMFLLEECLNA